MTIGSNLSIINPSDEEALIAEAGFTSVRLFYAGSAFRGCASLIGSLAAEADGSRDFLAIRFLTKCVPEG